MKHVVRSWCGGFFGLTLAVVLVLGAARVAWAQFGGAGGIGAGPPPVQEFTTQEVDPALMVQTLNELGKKRWEVFQIVPSWSISNANGVSELVPKSFHVFARRPVPMGK